MVVQRIGNRENHSKTKKNDWLFRVEINKVNFIKLTAFTKMLKYVQKNSKSCVMKEKETKNGLRLVGNLHQN